MDEKILPRIKVVGWISILLSLWFLFLLITELYTFLFASDRLRLLVMTKMNTMSFLNLEQFNQYTRFNIEYHFYLFVSLFGSSLAVLKFKDWGRKLLCFFSAMWIIVILYFRFVVNHSGLDFFAVLAILIYSVTIYYLIRSEARKHFNEELPNLVRIFGVLAIFFGLHFIYRSILHFFKQSLVIHHSLLFWIPSLFFGVTHNLWCRVVITKTMG